MLLQRVLLTFLYNMFAVVLIAPVVTCVFLLLVYTVYVLVLHRQYAHIPTPKGAW